MADERLSPVEEVQLLRAAACDWRLSRGDVGVFAVILRHCDGDLCSFPGPSRIAKEAGLSVTSVKSSTRALEQFRYLEVERPGLRKRNRFHVLPSPPVPPRQAIALSREMGLPSFKKHQRMNWSRGVAQSKRTPRAPTGQVQQHQTGQVRLHQLGKSARHELAFNSPRNSQQLLPSAGEEQERSADRANPDDQAFEEIPFDPPTRSKP